MHRLFAAIRPPAVVRDMLIDTMDGVAGARWQDDDQLHLTLRFAGEIEGPQAEDLADALARVAGGPFDLALRGVGYFEKKGLAHTLWAGVEASEPLAVLQRRVERACRAAGLAAETRKFAAHITLARLNRASGPIGGWLARHALLASKPWRVEAFALYSSRLTPAGSQYDALVRYPLG
ncbi:RNA 2',3'-cyclic phosphodiesterase [Pelagerythrobacter sp.]|uniref:RNA 2',3'-cyclic phosphodiesterase n=1 Tax=Pelagerythrobacter sp. TaxID=2800702 RepID=UPI0035B2C951